MPESNKEVKNLIRSLRDLDDLSKLLTGKRIPNLITRGIQLFGMKTDVLYEEQPSVDFNSPYFVLGVRSDAGDIVVRASYRALMLEMANNPEAQAKLLEAYKRIGEERQWKER